MFSLFQVLILLLIAFVIFKAGQRFVKKEISGWLFSIWLIFWLLIAVIAVFPQIINQLALWLGVGRGVDLVIYFSIFALFYILFKINVRLNKIEKNLTEVVRRNAVEEAVGIRDK